MTDDLVKRLREVGNKNGLMYADYDTTIEAADRIEQLEAALREMLHAVCHETGFAAAVRADSGKAYPWVTLDAAEAKARAALEGKD
jgi:hypothetical protein